MTEHDDLRDGIRVTTYRGRVAPGAEPFVLACWLKSYEPRGCRVHGLDADVQADRATYYRAHHPELTRLLRSSTLAMATVEEDPDVFLGWAVGSPGVLHYVFVKSAARGHGVGNRLVRAAAGDGAIVHTFEPSKRNGKANAGLLAVAARRGMRFHPHPIPGIAVHKQREARGT